MCRAAQSAAQASLQTVLTAGRIQTYYSTQVFTENICLRCSFLREIAAERLASKNLKSKNLIHTF